MKKVLVLDPGHGGTDSGALYKGRLEKSDNLKMALAVKPIVERHNVTVVLTRTADTTVSLQERCNISDKANADAFVSIHRNASEPEQASGVETFSFATSGAGRTLATNVQTQIVSVGVNRDRGLKTANFYVIKNTKAPAALVELGFIDTTKDNALFDAKFNDYAIAIAKGILKTLGITYVAAPVVTAPRQLKLGDNGNDVKALQTKLNTLGYKLVVDGDFGPGTNSAVKSFQTKQGLVSDGIVGPNTMSKLDSEIKKNAEIPLVNYETEMCRIFVDGENRVALTGKTKCINYAKSVFKGHIKIQCVKDGVFVAAFDNEITEPIAAPIVPEQPKPPVVVEKPVEKPVTPTPAPIKPTPVIPTPTPVVPTIPRENFPKPIVDVETKSFLAAIFEGLKELFTFFNKKK